ncbi:MAG: chemotaxis-specific protein-glutamate methyltransferase CheB [Thermoguttaceae bacterium]|jgi:two-component system chemotaxis response regulator CheB
MPWCAQILIVDDSRIFRAALEASLAGQEDIAIVGSVFSGEKALEFIKASPPDLVTLDVEMPGMGGLETLKAIQRINAGKATGTEVGVLMVSAYTKRGADITVQALQAGAFDFVTKPSGPKPEENVNILRQQLLGKIRLFMAERNRKRASVEPATLQLAKSAKQTSRSSPARSLQSPHRQAVRAIVIAASTGGPKALETLLPDLVRRVDLPIMVVQHMPPKFTQSLAENLARLSGSAVLEASDGDAVREKSVYIAPGGKHLLLRSDRGRLMIGLNEQSPENGCRPSADVLFRSAATAIQGGVLAIVLTGMGRDGTAGLGAIKRAGGYALVQDEGTSVVWGMPGSAVEAGLADEILPLGEIAEAAEALVAAVKTD